MYECAGVYMRVCVDVHTQVHVCGTFLWGVGLGMEGMACHREREGVTGRQEGGQWGKTQNRGFLHSEYVDRHGSRRVVLGLP